MSNLAARYINEIPILGNPFFAPKERPKKLRVVTLNYLPTAYKFLTDWIQENGHDHVLAVTTPGIKNKPTPTYKDVLDLVPKNVSAIVTSKMKTVLMPVLPQFKPDLILCFTFPHLLSEELCQIPTYGAVNIHPSVLPLYRGPNPLRQFYDGAKYFGATAHRIEPGYDTGKILHQEFEELPELVTQETALRWGQLISKCITQGVENAVQGKLCFQQNPAEATYAPPFTEAEKWVDLTEPTKVVLRKTLALNLCGGLAKAKIGGTVHKIHSAESFPIQMPSTPGKVLIKGEAFQVVATSDGAVVLVTEVFDKDKKYANILPDAIMYRQPKSSGHFQSMLNGVPNLNLV